MSSCYKTQFSHCCTIDIDPHPTHFVIFQTTAVWIMQQPLRQQEGARTPHPLRLLVQRRFGCGQSAGQTSCLTPACQCLYPLAACRPSTRFVDGEWIGVDIMILND